MGIPAGVNLALAVIYVSQMTTKQNYAFLSKTIAFQLALGYFLGIVFASSATERMQYLLCSICPVLVNMLRMLLFITVFRMETPQYYLHVLKDEEKANRVLRLVHCGDPQEYQPLSVTMVNNFKSYDLFSNKVIIKFSKCVALVIVLQMTGFFNITVNFYWVSSDLLLPLCGIVTALAVAVAQTILSQVVNRRLLIYSG